MKLHNDHRGFSLLEAIIATALVGLFVSACTAGLAYGVRATKDAGRKQQAMYLAEEGLAATQNIRDAAFTNLTNGTFGVTTTGNQWNLSGASDTTSIFTRAVTIATVDASKKQATSTVTWTDTTTKAQTLSLVTYFSDWLSATTSAWSGAVFAGSVDLSSNQNLLKIATAGNYAYGVRNVNGSANFFIFDISTPTAPIAVGSMTLSTIPSDIAVSGNYAYIASTDNNQELQIVNIAVPTVPALTGSYNASGNANANGVAISGNTAYLVRTQGADKEFLIINATVPAAPTLTGSLDLSDNANEVAISGNYAYIASNVNTQELQVINITTPSAPTLLGGYDLPTSSANATTVAVSGNIVYLGITTNLYILNDAVRGTPTLTSTLAQGGTVNDIALMGSPAYVFVGTSYASGELRIVDATTPASPTFIATVDLVSNTNGVAYNATSDVAVTASVANPSEFMVINHP